MFLFLDDPAAESEDEWEEKLCYPLQILLCWGKLERCLGRCSVAGRGRSCKIDSVVGF